VASPFHKPAHLWYRGLKIFGHHRFSLPVLWDSIPAVISGFVIIVYILVGAHSGSVAAATLEMESTPAQAVANLPQISALQKAVDQYLASIPADYYALSTVPALKNLMTSASPLLIDVRTLSEYQAGHIIGAVNIPLKELERHLEDIPINQEVVLYCSTGYRSAMGVMALQLQGYTHVHGFPPSLAGWEAAGEQVIVGESPIQEIRSDRFTSAQIPWRGAP
jgi:rhodanese-related sulfurtransferase